MQGVLENGLHTWGSIPSNMRLRIVLNGARHGKMQHRGTGGCILRSREALLDLQKCVLGSKRFHSLHISDDGSAEQEHTWAH